MASQSNDRLAPPLMHAFRAAHRERDAAVPLDIRDGGERVIAQRRAAARAPIAESELRRLVGSDIAALLNTVNLDSAENLISAPEVRKSILNFGFPDIVRISIDEAAVNGVAKQLETALRDFEPRLAPELDQGASRRYRVGRGIARAVSDQRRAQASNPSTSRCNSSRSWSSIRARSRSIGCRR